eukprot:scaffold46631_cov63-Phaeocystis_antarctica.AAC.3
MAICAHCGQHDDEHAERAGTWPAMTGAKLACHGQAARCRQKRQLTSVATLEDFSFPSPRSRRSALSNVGPIPRLPAVGPTFFSPGVARASSALA